MVKDAGGSQELGRGESDVRPRGANAIKERVAGHKRADAEKRTAEAARLAAIDEAVDKKLVSETRAEKSGMLHAHRKLEAEAQRLKNQFEHGDVNEFINDLLTKGEVVIASGVADEAMYEELNPDMSGLDSSVVVKDADPEVVSAAEAAVIREYEDLASARDKANVPVGKIKGDIGGFRQRAQQKKQTEAAAKNQTRLSQIEARVKGSEEYWIAAVKKTGGFAELSDVLAPAGLKLDVRMEGPVMKFIVEPEELDESVVEAAKEVPKGIASELIPVDEAPEARERREDRERQLVAEALRVEREKVAESAARQREKDDIAAERAALQRDRDIFAAEQKGYQMGLADGKGKKGPAQAPAATPELPN